MENYEKYKLMWMIDHGYTIEDLVHELDDARQNHHPQASLTEVFDEWEMNSGFSGAIWACENEWADCEAKMDNSVSRVILPFGEGENQLLLVAEDVGDPEFGPEIVVGIADKDAANWLQDIAIVRIRDEENIDPARKKPFVEALLYEDEYDEDYTQKIKINLYPQDGMELTLPEETFSEKKYISPQEALVRSLLEKGKVDMSYMTLLAGMDEEEVYKSLNGSIYPLPEEPLNDDGFCEYATAGEYLSGTEAQLKKRYEAAQDAAEMSAYFDANVEALKKIIEIGGKENE